MHFTDESYIINNIQVSGYLKWLCDSDITILIKMVTPMGEKPARKLHIFERMSSLLSNQIGVISRYFNLLTTFFTKTVS